MKVRTARSFLKKYSLWYIPVLFLIITPLYVSAQTALPPTVTTGAPIGSQTKESGLVPCGAIPLNLSNIDQSAFDATQCNFCYLAKLIQNIVNFLITLTIPISVGMFAWAGIKYFTSAADPKGVATAKKIFISTFWGFVLALSGWLIVQVVLQSITNGNFYNATNWTSLNCSNYSTEQIRPRDKDISSILGTIVSATPGGGGTTGGGTTGGGPPVTATNTNPQSTAQVQQAVDEFNQNNPNGNVRISSEVTSTNGLNGDLLSAVLNDVSGAGEAGRIVITSAVRPQSEGSLHYQGNAMDISATNSAQFLAYMQSNSGSFTPVSNLVVSSAYTNANGAQPAFRDSRGVVWSYEPAGSTPGNTGTHWHVSTTGN